MSWSAELATSGLVAARTRSITASTYTRNGGDATGLSSRIRHDATRAGSRVSAPTSPRTRHQALAHAMAWASSAWNLRPAGALCGTFVMPFGEVEHVYEVVLSSARADLRLPETETPHGDE